MPDTSPTLTPDAPSLLTSERPPVLGTSAEALTAADAIAALITPGAAVRDRERRAPLAELQAIASSGLLAIAVPREHGGPELPRATITEVFRRIARADSSIAQLLLTHFVVQESLRAGGPAGLAARIYADVLAGAQIGNAFSERGGRTAADNATVAGRDEATGRWRIDGRKYYATGALGASWIAVGAQRDGRADHRVTLFVTPETPGLDLRLDEWSAFGQRTTFSGGVLLDGVEVDDALVADPGPAPRVAELPPSLWGAYDQVLHAAIDVGVARAALEDGAAFVRTAARPRPEAGVDRASDEPHVLRRFGELSARVAALEALLARGAATIDDALALPVLTDQAAADASLAVAQAKALTQDLGVDVTSAIFELAGTSATDEEHGLDRHWRNVRTHSLHDPARWKYVAIGDHLLNGTLPPRDQLI
ncbi:acyl-CoA dehydrogenase family protein [Patulibacter sp. NPDC049589]|uniref:acyl-CoA dehydrogenase family protein n=1 Tax=Patulibacter sp. NPDC049589 TaxID=3154731 RepID=UPI003427AC1E